MATWFATAAGNINSGGLWNSAPDGSGSTLTWPPAVGDALIANGKTVSINLTTNLGAAGELRNDTAGGATAGGQFAFTASGISLTANIINNNATATVRTVAGTLFIVGNLYGGLGNSLLVNTATTVNLTGNVYAGSVAGIYAVRLETTSALLNQTGNAYGAIGRAIQVGALSSVSSLSLVGNIEGGNSVAVDNLGPDTATITGNALAGDASPALLNRFAGTATVTGYARASDASHAAQNDAQGIMTVGETRSASNGRGAVLGAFRFASATAAKSLPIIAGAQQTLSVLDVAALVPAVEDVRSGVKYGDGAYTGALALNRKRTTMAGRF